MMPSFTEVAYPILLGLLFWGCLVVSVQLGQILSEAYERRQRHRR